MPRSSIGRRSRTCRRGTTRSSGGSATGGRLRSTRRPDDWWRTARTASCIFAAGALRRAAERLEALPTAGTLEQTLITERDYFSGWAIRWLKEQEQSGAGGLRAKVKALLLGSEESEDILRLVDDNSAKRLIQAL